MEHTSFVVTRTHPTSATYGVSESCTAENERKIGQDKETTESIWDPLQSRLISPQPEHTLLYVLYKIKHKRHIQTVVKSKKMTGCHLLLTTCPFESRFPIRAAFPYIAQTVIQSVRPTLHKDLAALRLTDN